MPPGDEAILALGFDGSFAWRWRPREVDNDDLAFGAAPNLFTIDLGGAPREVLGIGNKDGSYTVLDRDGVNEVSGVAWNDVDPSSLPYWTRNVVPGGSIHLVISGVTLDVATSAGQSALQVAAQVAAAVNADPTLSGFGVVATAVGNEVFTNGSIDELTIEDLGLQPLVPILPAALLAALGAALAATGGVRLARRRRSLS
jgi:hypothetical protein